MPNLNRFDILSISIFCKIALSISIFSKITISISISISIFLELPYRYRYFSELPYRYRYRYRYFQLLHINIFQKCRYIDNRYVISIYRTGLGGRDDCHWLAIMVGHWSWQPWGRWWWWRWLWLGPVEEMLEAVKQAVVSPAARLGNIVHTYVHHQHCQYHHLFIMQEHNLPSYRANVL